jgi:serine/threonine-protein kinase
MGVVLRVTHLHLGEELAIKLLSPELAGDPDVRARFLREAQSAVRLRGEHVTRVSDVGMLPEGAPYIVMEYLRGGDLSAELGHRGMLPPSEIVDYVLQACEALAEAHALGIVHRDIKPSNLFLTHRPDGTPLVKVLDFGISKAPIAGPLLTRTDTVMGTPGYMSPEQMKASKDVDARTDIWALGIVLYECLNGRRPFDAESFSATVLRAATEPPPPMDPRIPRGLQAVVLRCLEKDRAARFQSMAELTVALAPFARDGRGAGIIVERTNAMLRGPGGNVAPVARHAQARTATTLSESAGMVRSQSRGRGYAIGGAAVLISTMVVLSAVSTRGSSGSNGLAAESNTRDAVSASDHVAMHDRVDTASGTSSTVAEQRSDTSLTVAVTPLSMDAAVEHPSSGADDKGRLKAAHCRELAANMDWQKLRDCASELAALGIIDKADELRGLAMREASNEAAAGRVQSALREGNLREAQKQLKTITPDSVYLVATLKLFHAAETQAVEDNRRKALAMADAHDCAGLLRLQAQINDSSTLAVTEAVAVVKCLERVASPSPGTANPIKQPNDGAQALPDTMQPGRAQNSSCDTMNVDDLIAEAQHQFLSGLSKSALGIITKAFACRQEVKMYRLAALYACAAREATSAKAYFTNVPPQYQSTIVQRCQVEGIILKP